MDLQPIPHYIKPYSANQTKKPENGEQNSKTVPQKPSVSDNNSGLDAFQKTTVNASVSPEVAEQVPDLDKAVLGEEVSKNNQTGGQKPPVQKSLGSKLGNFFRKVGNFFSGLWDSFTGLFKQDGAVAQFWNSIEDGANRFWNDFLKGLK